jgi:predicted MPP superfamily phosphohydrolase
VDDPDGLISTDWSAQLGACAPNDDIYAILLSHRPERGALYRDAGFDLALVGHAHGGQVRLPLLLNGLYAPNQGWFPKHAGGRYEIGDMTMIVSRGLQNWGLPRVFNPPEMVLVDIVPE